MKKLSTGDDSTLGNWRKLAAASFGKNSAAVMFLDKKIAADPAGAGAEVLSDEGQLLHALGAMEAKHAGV